MNSGEMPPEDKKQPKNDEKAEFLDELSLTMVKAREVLSDSGGKITTCVASIVVNTRTLCRNSWG